MVWGKIKILPIARENSLTLKTTNIEDLLTILITVFKADWLYESRKNYVKAISKTCCNVLT